MATYLITGANCGIGYEYCRQLQQRGDTVIAASRQPSNELKFVGCVITTRDAPKLTPAVRWAIATTQYLRGIELA